jgi:hypothetical protein
LDARLLSFNTTLIQQGGEMNIMTGQRFGVGIVGLQPGRGWAVRAHVPALRALPESIDTL